MMGRHKRFLSAFLLGVVMAAVLPLAMELRVLAGANGFFACYLGLMLRFAQTARADDLRQHAAQEDEGIAFILLLALGSVLVTLTAIYLVLNGHRAGGPLPYTLALVGVPLGWAMVHVLVAFHYAHLYYGKGGAAQGLVFPGADAPGPWDFLYFAFGIGMTAQVSDVTTNTSAMRRVVMVHAVGSFFYNTVILALAVNAAITASL
jgi:uncharacterized membrane protein